MDIKRQNCRGFTLLEMLIVAVIAGFIAVVAISGLRSITTARAMTEDVSDRMDRLRYAAEQIRTDLANAYTRSRGFHFEGLTDWVGGKQVKRLVFRTYRDRPLRKQQPEGDLYEVEYFITETKNAPILMRRVCPIVGVEDADQTTGGVLEEIAGLDTFDALFYDGKEWLPLWTKEQAKLPQIAMIMLKNSGDAGRIWARQVAVQFPQAAAGENLEDVEVPETQE